MSLFRNENPNLGPATTVQELSGFGAGNPVANNYKPTTRQFIESSFDAVRNTASQLTGYLFVAPWKCQVIKASFVCQTVSSNASSTLQAFSIPQGSQPENPSAGNAILSAALNLNSGVVANTVAVPALSATAANLVLNPGDAVGYVLAAAPTALVGGLLQIEVVQLG